MFPRAIDVGDEQAEFTGRWKDTREKDPLRRLTSDGHYGQEREDERSEHGHHYSLSA